ncbi:arrestin domain-containing protein [Histoplasma ohiense]|nr:arrestin domain-containing protein [Histoplasma ohiense (nom. inval.)]
MPSSQMPNIATEPTTSDSRYQRCRRKSWQRRQSSSSHSPLQICRGPNSPGMSKNCPFSQIAHGALRKANSPIMANPVYRREASNFSSPAIIGTISSSLSPRATPRA